MIIIYKLTNYCLIIPHSATVDFNAKVSHFSIQYLTGFPFESVFKLFLFVCVFFLALNVKCSSLVDFSFQS